MKNISDGNRLMINVLYAQDSQLPGNLKVCPKLSSNHVKLSISDKMRVRFATQVPNLALK